MAYGQYIGQHNNGNHTALFQDVDTYLSGLDMPVAIVDGNGNFMGWATFHVNSASGGSNKHINGYFLSSFTSDRLTVGSCAEQRLPALPRLVRPEAHELGRAGASRAAAEQPRLSCRASRRPRRPRPASARRPTARTCR